MSVRCPRPWTVGAIWLSLLLWGCQADPVGAPGVQVPLPPDVGDSPTVVASVQQVDPTPFLTEAGCAEVSADSSFVGVVGFFTSNGPYVRFDCRGVPDELKRDAISRYQEEVRAAIAVTGMTLIVAAGNWEIIDMYVSCETTIIGRGGWMDGKYYELGDMVVTCRWVREWGWVDPYGTPYTGDEMPDAPPPSGGPGTPPPPPPPPPLCPGNDPSCWRALTATEIDELAGMLAVVFANESNITNGIALAVCQASKQSIQDAVAGYYLGDPDKIGMGNWDPEPVGYITEGHSAEAYGGRIHVDPGVFLAATTPGPNQDAYQRGLVVLLMHELRHIAPFNEQHPNEDAWKLANGSPTTPAGLAAMYADDYPFKYLHSQNPAEMCVKPY